MIEFFEAESIGAHWGHVPLVPPVKRTELEALEPRSRIEKLLQPICHAIVNVRV